MPYGTVNADVIQTSTTGGILGAGNASTMKNRIINGAMIIDQRNAGASVTPVSNQYLTDRFYYGGSQTSKVTAQQNAGSVTPPVGFSNYLGITSSSAYSVVSSDYFFLEQPIEGFNTSDLMFGTSNAKTITLSFWVYSSLTGTFGGSLRNSALNRSYPFSYTISSANTWTQASITIAGDTTGTWIGATNGVGLRVAFGLGMGSTYSGTAGSWSANNYASATGATSVVGTSGATFYITGVQLEVGSSATGFEYRQYTTELQLCQRYYEVIGGVSLSVFADTYSIGSNVAIANISFAVNKRATPTISQYGTFTTGNTGAWAGGYPSQNGFSTYYSASAVGRAFWYTNASSGFIASIEL